MSKIQILNLYLQKIKKKIYALGTTGLRLSWLSYGVKVTNNSFKLFDATKEFDAQIRDENFNTLTASISYNLISNLKYTADKNGKIRRATVKTSLFTGVYFKNDKIIRRNFKY